MAGWRDGEEASVRAVFEAYYPRAVRLAVLSGLAPDAAHDCAQESFTQAFERRAQLRDSQAFPLWFHRIVTRRIFDTLAAQGRGHDAPLDDTTDLGEDWQRRRAPQPDELALAAEQRAQLWERVQALPPNYRVPLVLRYYADYSMREIAEALGMREGTARVTLSRALARLRAQVTAPNALPDASSDAAPEVAPDTSAGAAWAAPTPGANHTPRADAGAKPTREPKPDHTPATGASA